MPERDLIALIDTLRALPRETEWVEFKTNHVDPQKLGEYLSGLSNAACLARVPRGYLVFGIDDESHDVKGTRFNPQAEKRGGQELELWLNRGLTPRCGLVIHVVEHPVGGRVVLFEIHPAAGQPVAFYGVEKIRIGTSLTNLREHPDREQAIWQSRRDWSAEVCPRATLADLDPEAIAKAREEFSVKHNKQAHEVPAWDDVTFLSKAKLLRRGDVTNAAILLLGRPEASVLLAPAVARVSWILKDAHNREVDYEHFGPPLLLTGDRVLSRIRNLTIRAMPSGTLFPTELSMYDPWVIREALHNCIAHQDYGLQGRISVVEFPSRLLLTNKGSFLPESVEEVIRMDAPPHIYRNPLLAEAMVELNMIDTQGGGIKRMFAAQRERSFPMPDYDITKPDSVSVAISGTILDERYSRLLLEKTDLDLHKVILLDRVQKRLVIPKEEARTLRAEGLVEGRYPKLMVAASLARVVGKAGQHIRDRGLERRYYLDMILDLVRSHGPVGRRDMEELLMSKLPDRLTEKQKRTLISNLLWQLRKEGKIINRGTRAKPRWVLLNSIENEEKKN